MELTKFHPAAAAAANMNRYTILWFRGRWKYAKPQLALRNGTGAYTPYFSPSSGAGGSWAPVGWWVQPNGPRGFWATTESSKCVILNLKEWLRISPGFGPPLYRECPRRGGGLNWTLLVCFPLYCKSIRLDKISPWKLTISQGILQSIVTTSAIMDNAM